MNVFEKTISEIVEENFLYGRALHHMGIDFFAFKADKLMDVCALNGLDKKTVIRNFYKFDSNTRIPFYQIADYPLSFLLKYLQHSHTLYIKEYLPYVGKLIESLSEEVNSDAAKDLKSVFPLFLEDFINHIYEEEDIVFQYLKTLIYCDNHPSINPFQRLYQYFDISLTKLRDEHSADDEMKNMRELIEDISPDSLEINIIVQELKAFDRELLYHSEIEDQILFPKAIELEKKVWTKMSGIAKAN